MGDSFEALPDLGSFDFLVDTVVLVAGGQRYEGTWVDER